jgi:hypothetical protein
MDTHSDANSESHSCSHSESNFGPIEIANTVANIVSDSGTLDKPNNFSYATPLVCPNRNSNANSKSITNCYTDSIPDQCTQCIPNTFPNRFTNAVTYDVSHIRPINEPDSAPVTVTHTEPSNICPNTWTHCKSHNLTFFATVPISFNSYPDRDSNCISISESDHFSIGVTDNKQSDRIPISITHITTHQLAVSFAIN